MEQGHWEEGEGGEEAAFAAAVRETGLLEGAPSSSRSGSARSVASLLADNSFAEWLGSERSRSSSRFGLDSPSDSLASPLAFETLAAGTSTCCLVSSERA